MGSGTKDKSHSIKNEILTTHSLFSTENCNRIKLSENIEWGYEVNRISAELVLYLVKYEIQWWIILSNDE